MLDRVLGGRLERVLAQRRTELTYRQLIREGFAGRPAILALSELIVGRTADTQLDGWEASFLPRLFVEQLQSFTHTDGRPLLGERIVATPLLADPVVGDPQAGVKLLWGLGALLSLLGLATWTLIRRRSRLAGLTLLLPALLLGLCGALLTALATVSSLPDLRHNELLLLLWPTDLLLVGVAVRLLRGHFYAGRLLRGYCTLRPAAGGATLLGQAVGVLIQPTSWLLVAALPLALIWLSVRALPAREPQPAPRPNEALAEDRP